MVKAGFIYINLWIYNHKINIHATFDCGLMADNEDSNGLSLKTRGTKQEKIIVAILILVPIIVFAATPLYNFSDPTLFGLTFFYWFQTFWLFVSSVFFLVAAWLLNRMEGEAS